MNEPVYKRLTRPRRRTQFALALVSRCSLWMTDDHLLHIDSNGYSETYRRFYFKDLQAITIAKTNSWIYQILALVFFIIMCAVAALAIGDPAAYWIFGVLAAALLAGVLYVAISGPTCICQFRTAVQAEHIPSLRRIRKTRRILARIRPLIEQTQGTLSAPEARERMDQWLTSGTIAAEPATYAANPVQPDPAGQTPA